MKIKDYVIFGSNATAALAKNTEELVTWRQGGLTYYDVEPNDAVELVELGVYEDLNSYKLFIRDKDNTDWFNDGFFILGASAGYGGQELPFDSRPDFSRIRAPVTPDVSVRRSPTLKMSTGERFRVYVKPNASQAHVSKVRVVAVLRNYTATTPQERANNEAYGRQFGGMESNAQIYHAAEKLTSSTANEWTDIIELLLLKAELYAFNSPGVMVGADVTTTEVDLARLRIDEKILYNEYPVVGGAENMIPVADMLYDPGLTGARSVKRAHIFDKPLVVSKKTNKKLEFQALGTTAIVAETQMGLHGRLRGMRYRIDM
jgi:hypothetical protein